jgi:hypothetical protein
MQSLVVLRTWRERDPGSAGPWTIRSRPRREGPPREVVSGGNGPAGAAATKHCCFEGSCSRSYRPERRGHTRAEGVVERDQLERIRLQRFLPHLDSWISASDDHMRGPLCEHPRESSGHPPSVENRKLFGSKCLSHTHSPVRRNRDSPRWLGRLGKFYSLVGPSQPLSRI